MQEIWKPVPGYEGLYDVSNLGRVRSLTRRVTRNVGVTKLVAGRILREQWTARRYAQISLSKNGVIESAKVHRLVAKVFVENALGLAEVNHKDGNRKNNAAVNLEWVTRAENNDHAISTGLKPPVLGESHGQSRFTEQDVLTMRARYAEGVSMSHIAKLFTTSITTISGIVKRRYWTHI